MKRNAKDVPQRRERLKEWIPKKPYVQVANSMLK